MCTCCLVVSTSAIDCLERLVSEMTCYVKLYSLSRCWLVLWLSVKKVAQKVLDECGEMYVGFGTEYSQLEFGMICILIYTVSQMKWNCNTNCHNYNVSNQN